MLVDYLGSLSSNIFSNVSYLPLYFHSAQTDGFQLFTQFVQQNFCDATSKPNLTN